MEELSYAVEDATIAQLLGVSNFSSAESAVLELVKNSYDAGSGELAIRFESDKMIFADSGKGMSSEDIKKFWMYVGKTSKGYSEKDKCGQVRVQAGSKGVGRFALARLGSSVVLRSKKKGHAGVLWMTDWESSQLDRFEGFLNPGTIIEVLGLRDRWTPKRIKALEEFLSKTYNDDKMRIILEESGTPREICPYYDRPMLGYNCAEIIKLSFDSRTMILRAVVESDEFDPSVLSAVPSVESISGIQTARNVFEELYGSRRSEWTAEEFEEIVRSIGDFDAEFYFRLISPTREDVAKFFYRHGKLPAPFDSGVVLYRNAFSISSFEGSKDWIGFGRRARKSPASP